MKNKTLCIIQARMGSTRLSKKTLKKVKGIPLLAHLLKRVKKATTLDRIVVATTTNPEDQVLVKFCRNYGIASFAGPVEDVLARYYLCSLKYPKYQAIVRLTGDCPLIDPQVIDEVVKLYKSGSYDYASNIRPPTYPDGMDTEIFHKSLLAEAYRKAKLASEREHVTPYMVKHKRFRIGNHIAPTDFSHFRLCVDNKEDLEVIGFLLKNSSPDETYLGYISILTKHPEIMAKNMHIMRNEGLAKSLKSDHIIKK